ncbi:hypothetical protein ACEPAI_2433 [Sanghuangporus weigelae]
MALLKFSLAALCTLAVYGFAKLVRRVLRPLSSPLRSLPGPRSSNFIYGNLSEIRKADVLELHEKWAQEYGNVFKYKAFFGEDRLCTMDLRAINHILTHSIDYQKPPQARRNLARLLGDGILVTEGEKHRQQRRIMNPSFGPSSIRDLTPIFFEKALQLRDIWKSEVMAESEKAENGKIIEVLSWLSRTTLDVIGLAGFDYHFDSLNVHQEPGELNKAFATLFHADGSFGILQLLQAFFPIFNIIPSKRGNEERRARGTMQRIGQELLREKKTSVNGKFYEEREQGRGRGKDLLSVLVRANMDVELPDSQRIPDEDVLAQVPTFLVAGHETTSTQTTWAIWVLAQRPDFQDRLRGELRSIDTDTPSVDDLSAERLPFLDAVVRETLRSHSAVPSTVRLAMKDDLIPVSEPYRDKKGKICNSIRIRKGDTVFVPILAINRYSQIWGEDAHEFNPDRWTNPPPAVQEIPGVWGNLMTFLGGARSCIGYRFALYEMKALLFTLIRNFEFSLAVPAERITKRSLVVTRPYIKDEEDKGAQMPLLVKVCDP